MDKINSSIKSSFHNPSVLKAKEEIEKVPNSVNTVYEWPHIWKNSWSRNEPRAGQFSINSNSHCNLSML